MLLNIEWAEKMNCAVTVCDHNGIILYMNEKARDTFASHGDLIGKNLFECHSPASAAKIREMLISGESNSYTIQKGEIHKMIYQTPWRNSKGEIAGMVEISMVIPATLPHHIRS